MPDGERLITEAVTRLPDIASHGHDVWWEGDLRVTRTAGRVSEDQPPGIARVILEQADPQIILSAQLMDSMGYRFPVTRQPDGTCGLTITADDRSVRYLCSELPCGCWQGLRQEAET